MAGRGKQEKLLVRSKQSNKTELIVSSEQQKSLSARMTSSDPGSSASSSAVGSPTTSEPLEFEQLFDCFAKVGDRNSEDITLRNADKWFKQAKLFNRDLTTTDTAILFAKVAKNKKKLTRDDFREFLREIAEEKQMQYESLESSLKAAGKPSFIGVTRPIRGSIAADNMERLCNTSSFTGTHKQRFDEEGKGLGLAGRYDVVQVDGYVQGYTNQGSYGSLEDIDDEQKSQ